MNSPFLAIIVDGYNFLLTTGMMAENIEGIELEKGRKRLLSFLASQFPSGESKDSKSLPNKNVTKTPQENRSVNEKLKTSQSIPKLTVVFDSQTKLRLPTRLSYQGIDVRFSKGYENADELIIEMIQSFDVPKRLLVVSSDHEIQTAAKRRRATPIDSDVWLDQLEANAKDESDSAKSDSTKSGKAMQKPVPTATDTEHWLDVFSDIELNEEVLLAEKDLPDELPPDADDETASSADAKELSSDRESEIRKNPKFKEDLEKLDLDGFNDIFPPGYGEDLF